MYVEIIEGLVLVIGRVGVWRWMALKCLTSPFPHKLVPQLTCFVMGFKLVGGGGFLKFFKFLKFTT